MKYSQGTEHKYSVICPQSRFKFPKKPFKVKPKVDRPNMHCPIKMKKYSTFCWLYVFCLNEQIPAPLLDNRRKHSINPGEYYTSNS